MNNLDAFYNMCQSWIIDTRIKNEAEIDKLVDSLSIMANGQGIKQEDIDSIKNKLKSEMSITLKLGDCIEGDHKYKKWFVSKKADLDMDYWNRYKKYLQKDKHFSVNVINGIDDVLDKLTDLLGDPTLENSFSRRGLVVGDVQSGKTSNYIGLMCKAADAGYNVIVLLTGTIERLRQQTQLRVDEGFTGRESAIEIKGIRESSVIGAGKYTDPCCGRKIRPVVLTSTESDFNAAIAKSVNLSFDSLKDPILVVVKKHVSPLKHLNNWIRAHNQHGNDKIDKSLLLIDDESDNASVNTNKEDEDPTAINAEMRDLLNKFKKSSYVGFTATPFANIFIQPETDDDMFKEDLFPKDYIYSLDAPSNYIGARDIFNEDGEYKNILVEIDEIEIENCIPKRHKSDFTITNIPTDLKDAIYVFLLANVIRDLRGDKNTHRSMLVNVSRFTDVQNQLYDIVNSLVKNIQDSVRLNSKLREKEAIKDRHIAYLKYTFEKFYSDTEFNWEQIQNSLHKSIAPVLVAVVNKDHKGELDYENNPNGMRVIAIGGLSLSRGLTLEGLIVSYFYRNSRMYDTLMQMGRWFGYRKGYEDLCRIWMTEESISWYEHISMATDELREEIKRYQDTGLTPKDFGLRVRSDINSLIVTARNKMRSSSTLETSISLSGDFVETPQLYADKENNEYNVKQVNIFISKLVEKNYILYEMKKSRGFYNVSSENIIEFLESCRMPVSGLYDVNVLKDFIQNYPNSDLDYWDVAFVSGGADNKFKVNNEDISMVERSFTLRNNNKIIQMGGKRNRLGGTSDTTYGLTEEQIKEVKQAVKQSRGINSNPNQRDYLNYTERRPLLLIYPLVLKDYGAQDKAKGEEIKKNLENTPIIGISINIPKLDSEISKKARYQVNKTYLDKLYEEFNDYEDGEED